MSDSLPPASLLPLPSISHQDIQEATQADSEIALTAEQINQINSELGGEATHTGISGISQEYLNPPIHYQLQGTWETPSGKYVNYIVLKDSLESKIDISRIYMNIEDINKCRGFNLDLTGVNDRYHLNLLNIILEFPQSELVLDLFKAFLSSLNPGLNTEVLEPLSTPNPRIIESKVPKVQLKLESYLLEAGGGGGDSDREEFSWQEDIDEEDISKEDKIDFKNERKEKGIKMTSDEKRFFDICRSLGQRPTRKDHFLILGVSNEPVKAVCLHCKNRFSAADPDLEVQYRDTIALVVDHILLQHFQTFAYKCDMCVMTFNTKEAFSDHMVVNHREEMDRFQCKDCTLGFLTRKDLKSHERLTHDSTDTGLNIKCKSCDKTFSSKKTMHAHLRGIHGISSKSVKREKHVTMCTICGENKKSEHNLAQHIKKFHENPYPEPITCPRCTDIKQLRNRKYHTPYSFDLHMKQIHSNGGEGKVVCEYCCKEFTGSIGKVKFALKEHIQAIHLGIRKACDECGKTFISNIVLNKHKKHVHRREGAYPCKACGKIFRYSQQAIDHEYKDRGLTPYVCKHCTFKSADNWALAKHKKTCLRDPGLAGNLASHQVHELQLQPVTAAIYNKTSITMITRELGEEAALS